MYLYEAHPRIENSQAIDARQCQDYPHAITRTYRDTALSTGLSVGGVVLCIGLSGVGALGSGARVSLIHVIPLALNILPKAHQRGLCECVCAISYVSTPQSDLATKDDQNLAIFRPLKARFRYRKFYVS